MLRKSVISLALIPELDFELGMAVLCSKVSEKCDFSLLLDYADYFNSTWVRTILRGR